jgi:hypothetical protein
VRLNDAASTIHLALPPGVGLPSAEPQSFYVNRRVVRRTLLHAVGRRRFTASQPVLKATLAGVNTRSRPPSPHPPP